MNKKGFTLIELLAVIVILGIIMAIAIPSVISISKNSKGQMYDTKVDMIEKAAELYGEDNLDATSGQSKIVTVNELVNYNYLKKDKKDCSGNDCIIDPRTNEGMGNQKVCVCTVNKKVVAELIDINKTDCSSTICDSSYIDVPQVKLTYDSQGGSTCQNKKVVYGNNWGELCNPTKSEYDFVGWYTQASGGTQITSSTKADSNLTVYAHWVEAKKTLTYDSQGGSACSSKTVTTGSQWGELCSPTKTGHTFAGWYTQASGGTQVTSSSTASSNLTVYAHWTINQYYLDLNGYLDGIGTGNITGYGRASIYINGSLVESNVSDWYQSYPYGTTYEIKNITTTTGHTYNGVYSGSLSGTITGNVNVVLKYTTESRYVYASAGSGGSVSPTSKVLKYNEGASFTVTPSSGYYLSSYSCDSGLTLSSSFGTGSSYTGSQTRTIYNYSSGTGSKYCYFYFSTSSRRIYTRTYSNFDVVVGYEEIGSSDELNDKYLAYDDVVVDTVIVCDVSPYYRDLNYGESGTFTVQLGSNYYLEYISCDSGVTYSGFSTGKSTQGRTITGTITNNSTGSDSKYCNFYYDYVNTASEYCAYVMTKDSGGYNGCVNYYDWYTAVYSCNRNTGYATFSKCYNTKYWDLCDGRGWHYVNNGLVNDNECLYRAFYKDENNCACTTYLSCCNSGVMYSSYSSGVISPSDITYKSGNVCVSTC